MAILDALVLPVEKKKKEKTTTGHTRVQETWEVRQLMSLHEDLLSWK